MMRKELFDRFNLRYSIEYLHAEDYELWQRCSTCFEIVNIGRVLLRYRTSPTSYCRVFSIEQNDIIRRTDEKNLKLLGIDVKDDYLKLQQSIRNTGFTPNAYSGSSDQRFEFPTRMKKVANRIVTILRELASRLKCRLMFLTKSSKTRTAKKLHLGCGDIHIHNYCNVDIDYLPTVDIVDDILTLRKFSNNYAEQIYACHVLEHLGHSEVLPTLQRWFDVLKPGGELRISVPDIDRIVKVYCKNWQHFQTKGNTPWIGLLYGGQLDPYDYHKTGFNFCWLSKLLEDAGFVDIEEYPHDPHFITGVCDASLAKEPFGEYLSLNIKAKKPT